ncbi:TonB-dependent receptor [Pseudomaricurvus alkylphenolicus]|uniref:TonB-dependent receptor n=1 Tax=Pseudomaricurvus alkylphenolicus TaxID=1306991 RepID=UPI001421F708|nr:TonB-dependent receptor [Pseudomaricurvus alkylphenolicus]NIB41778.1 TonB-dependent receptor [Pseudomaricurvus alkylphenolicus]
MITKRKPAFTKTAIMSAISMVTATGVMAESALVLEEIIITAQKREQNLQGVPVSVSAISGDQILESGIKDLTALSSYVPNLKISEGPAENGVYIRGLGSGENQGFEQSVGMFVDGVYAGKARQFQAPFLDVGSVEVLRGPQGTLYGKNTIAGSITITSARPTDTLEASILTEYEFEEGSQTTEAVLSGPLAENLTGRIALRHSETDGFIDNTLQNDEEMNSNVQTGRVSLLWTPLNKLDVFFKYENGETETAGKNNRVIDATAAQMVAYTFFDPDFDIDEYQRSTSDAETMKIDSESFTLNVTYDFGSHELTSNLAYSTFEANDIFDTDFSPADVISVALNQEYQQISQELRLTSALGEKFDYIAGFYYQKSEFNTDRLLGVGTSTAALARNPVLAGLGYTGTSAGTTGFNSQFFQDSETYAIFGSLSWHQTEDITWTLGLRYSSENKEANRSLLVSEYLGTSAQTNPAAILDMNILGIYTHSVSGEHTDKNVSPSLKLQYDVSGNVMLYASLSKAFKSGGYSEPGLTGDDDGEYSPAGTPTTFSFDQEEALAFELGGKTTLLNGSAVLNFALFNTEYDDLQVSTYDGLSFVVGNAAKAISRGVEVDGMVRLSESLTMSGSMAYLDARYDEFPDTNCTYEQLLLSPVGCTQDLGGETLANAPKWTVNMAIEHVTPLSSNLELMSRIDVNYTDDQYLASDLDERSLQVDFTLVNARLALSNAEGSWEVALLGKNLTGEEYFTMAGDSGFQDGAFFAFSGAPRTLAIQLKLAI